jgi:4-hydroxybenzoate polyprenyltransferase
LFCLISSAVYILNDVMDRDRDREHPRKCKRPIAAGLIAPRTAIAMAVCLGLGALVGAWQLGASVFVCAGLYVLNNVAYSTGMKHFALFDVLAISIGFILRLLAGIYPVGDLPTAWIVLCVFFLSLFLGFSKRRAELGARPADECGGITRPVLVHYTREFLDQLIAGSAVMSILCYALFTVVGEKNPSLIITIPIVFYAIMHYARLVMNLRGGEEPERILIMDRNLQASILWWLAIYTFIVHGRIHIFR